MRVVDLASAPAELDVEARGRLRVEGEHPVVRVLAEAVRDRNAGGDAALVAEPDVLHPLRLDHEMVDALAHRRLEEGQRVVARVRVKEGDAEPGTRRLDVVRDAHAEQVAVEAASRLGLARPDDDVAEAFVAGAEARRDELGAERLASLCRAAVELDRQAVRILDLDERVDATVGARSRAALAHR